MSKVRVRFAPSPTGPLHIGGVRTALYNYLLAKKNQGDFILRIEDTDQTRFVEGAEQYIKESLSWLGISPDEGPGIGGNFGPYRQSERKEMYQPFVTQLLEKGDAYYAFDTVDELEQMRARMKKTGMQPRYDTTSRMSMKNSLTLSKDEVEKRMAEGAEYVVRIKMPRKEEIKFHDEIRGYVSVQSNQIDDKVILKSDGLPTYHLANVVDDHLMGITHIVRGEEWLPSAPLSQPLVAIRAPFSCRRTGCSEERKLPRPSLWCVFFSATLNFIQLRIKKLNKLQQLHKNGVCNYCLWCVTIQLSLYTDTHGTALHIAHSQPFLWWYVILYAICARAPS